MSNPTDTNQASEDELKKPSERKKLFDRLVFMFSWKGETRRTKANKTMKAIDQYTESLIRTEKLKLLAEVRERVVGEDETRIPADGGPFTNTTDKPNHYITLRNANRADQRAALTQLEAEL